ncbi:MAG: HD domain-containing protein [Deltaproteobacteria bacterium]|nr:HD domain-containing protein [Deltaproteobacteria bacterium]
MSDVIEDARTLVREALERGERGKKALVPYVDEVERTLANAFEKAFQGQPHCSLLAVGGLARRTLCPHADVDVWVLLHDEENLGQISSAESFVQECWNLHLNLAQAVGAKAQLLERCVLDDQAATALLEARVVAGCRVSADDMLHEFRARVLPLHRDEWIEAKLEERRHRRQKEGDRVQRLEPSLKNAPGGLRDLHLVAWLHLLRRPIPVYDDALQHLLEYGVLHLREVRELQQSREVLLTLRAALHVIRGRPDDRLSFDVLDEISVLLQTKARGDLSGMERAMRFYFEAALGVQRTSDIIVDRFLGEEALRKGPLLKVRRLLQRRTSKLIEGTFVEGGRLLMKEPHLINDDLARMIDVVRIGAEHNVALAARTKAHLLSAVGVLTENNKEQFYDDNDVGEALCRLASCENIKGAPFTELLELGILPLAMRDFTRLFCRFKADGYHVLSTDAHSAYAADLALQLNSKSTILTSSLDEIRERNQEPMLLVLSALFHDLGKGLDGAHAEFGVKIFKREAARFPLSQVNVGRICVLIKEHLRLSFVSQRRDLADPDVIDEVAAVVNSPELLDLLTLLTIVDVSAVAPGMFSDWKAQLLARCTEKVHSALARPGLSSSEGGRFDEDASMVRSVNALKRHFGVSVGVHAQSFVERITPRYLGSRGEAALMVDFKAWRRFEEDSFQTKVFVEEDAGGNRLLVRVVARDRPRLFADLAAALTAEGMNILHLHLGTLSAKLEAPATALEAFVIEARHGTAVDEMAQNMLHEALTLAAEGERKSVAQRVAKGGLDVTTKIRILEELDFWGNTIVEVRTKDHPGVLAELAAAFAAQGWRVVLAMASTDGLVVRDSFYIRRLDSLANEKVTAREREALGRELLVALRTN